MALRYHSVPQKIEYFAFCHRNSCLMLYTSTPKLPSIMAKTINRYLEGFLFVLICSPGAFWSRFDCVADQGTPNFRPLFIGLFFSLLVVRSVLPENFRRRYRNKCFGAAFLLSSHYKIFHIFLIYSNRLFPFPFLWHRPGLCPCCGICIFVGLRVRFLFQQSQAS